MTTLGRLSCVLAATALAIGTAAAQPAQKTFASPEQAVEALRAAVKVHDKAALEAIFGPQVHELLTGDERQDKANSRRFAKSLAEGAAPVSEGADKVLLEIGGKKWLFPVPLVKEGAAWRFDTAAGKAEIVNRHIGKDELHAIGVCEAYGRAPKTVKPDLSKPYHGYLFKRPPQIGAGGFALIAYPENWGHSGIMTFVVAQDGRLYQRDLGAKTTQLVAAMTNYTPAAAWTLVKDPGVTEK
jgi:hypothetical protein